jgi:hypothetical protein
MGAYFLIQPLVEMIPGLTTQFQDVLEVIPKKYFPTVYTLHHSIFLPSIATSEKIIIRKSVIREYLQELDPVQLLSLLYH